MQSPEVDAIRCLFEQASQVTIRLAVDAFLAAECSHRSAQTARWYAQRLRRMAAALGEQRGVGDVLEWDVLAYFAGIQGVSAFTLHGHGRAIKRFWRWMYGQGIMQVDLSLLIHLPRLPRQGRKGISEENVRLILEAAGGRVRDLAILRFLEASGCRRGGLAGLLLDDLNLHEEDERLRRRVTVLEKGERSRTVVIDQAALQALEAWLEVRPEVDDRHVFLGRQRGGEWKPIQPDGLSRMIERYKRRLGLRGACSPHQWRHRWARLRISRGMSIGDCSRLMGHSDIKVTHEYYGDFDFETLQGVADRYSDQRSAVKNQEFRPMLGD